MTSLSRRGLLAGTGGALAALTSLRPAGGAVPIQTTDHRSKSMQITRIGSQPSRKGPDDYFTGTVRVDPLFQAPIRRASAAPA